MQTGELQMAEVAVAQMHLVESQDVCALAEVPSESGGGQAAPTNSASGTAVVRSAKG